MAKVTFTLKSAPNFGGIDRAFLGTAHKTLGDEVKRVARNRFRPLVRPWTAKNRTSFRTKQSRPRNGAKATITAIDKEDDKRLFKWVHQTGTRPHVIRPTKAHGLLVWQGQNGTVFHRGSVNHPGFKSSGKYDLILAEEPDKIRRELEFALSRNLNIVRC